MRQRDCIKYNFRNKNVHLLIYINNFEYLLISLLFFPILKTLERIGMFLFDILKNETGMETKTLFYFSSS